jgi:hypothetical protein
MMFLGSAHLYHELLFLLMSKTDIVLDYAGDHRFQIHPVKSNAIIKTVGKRKIRQGSRKTKMNLNLEIIHCTSNWKLHILA